MDKKNLFICVFICLIIFSVGFFLRIESITIHGVNETEKLILTDENDLPYMYELDSYYNLRITQNYLKNGHFGDTIKYNQSWDSLSYYPPGRPAEYPPLIVWVAVIFYYLANIFTNTSLLVSSFWLPAFLAPLAGIVGYLFVRKYLGEYAGLVTGILLVTAPIYFIRTVPGFFDTDMFNILLPLLIVWFFSEAIESSKKSYMYFNIIMASFSLVLFALAWVGWSYILYIMILTALIYVIMCKIKKIDSKNFIKIFLIFLIISLTSILIISGFKGLLSVIEYPFTILKSLRGISEGTWPNIYQSVGELIKPSLNDFIAGVGPVNLGLGLFGLVIIASVMLRPNMRTKYLPNLSWFIFVLILLWAIIASITYLSSIRFAIILIPPISIFSGILVGLALSYLERSHLKTFNNKIFHIIIVFLLLIICIPAIININNFYTILDPGANDDMMNASAWIKSNTDNKTVIISEWSYGHFFTEFAHRPVLADGGSQNTPRTYWIYRAFATDNESLSAGIFRMLSSSGDESYSTLDNYTKNTSLTVKIMNEVLGIPRDDAEEILINKYHIPIGISEKILNDTHNLKNPDYIIFTTDKMKYIANWVFEFGDWDFEKLKGNNFTYSYGTINSTGKLWKYSNNVRLNTENHNVTWNGNSPFCAVFVKSNSSKTIYINNNSNFCTIFLLDSGEVWVFDKKFEKSLFTKLVLIKNSTAYFKPVYKNNSVVIWKTNY